MERVDRRAVTFNKTIDQTDHTRQNHRRMDKNYTSVRRRLLTASVAPALIISQTRRFLVELSHTCHISFQHLWHRVRRASWHVGRGELQSITLSLTPPVDELKNLTPSSRNPVRISFDAALRQQRPKCGWPMKPSNAWHRLGDSTAYSSAYTVRAMLLNSTNERSRGCYMN